MKRHLAILDAAADNVMRLRTRSLVIVCSLVGILSPFLIATAVYDAVKAVSAVSVAQGADLYVSANEAGRNGALPARLAETFKAVPGVERAVPRIVGRDYLVGPVVVVGLPVEAIPREAAIVTGRLPTARGEAVVGRELAAEMNLAAGTSFTLNVNPGIRFKVVGIFTGASPLWSARLVYLRLDDAQALYGMAGEATEILLYTRPGYADPVYERLRALGETGAAVGPLRVTSKRIAGEMLRRGFSRRAGIFAALYLVAFALAIPCLAVASGLGFAERRREIGLLRATGWQTEEVLEMALFENLILSLSGATLALSASFLWMKLTNGFLIAQFFLPEAGLAPGFDVPTRFLPLPAALAYLIAFTLTMTGSLYTTYRTAIVPPMEAIQ